MDPLDDVTVDSSTTTPDANAEQTVQSPADSSSASQPDQTPTTPPQDGVIPEPEEDKQVDKVARRVTQFIAPQLKQMLEERLSQQTYQPAQAAPQTAPSQPQDQWQTFFNGHSDEAIESWAEENPQYKTFARAEIKRRLKDSVLSEFKQETAKERTEREKQEALGMVAQTYTEAFTTNPMGQKSWNLSSPLVQRAFALYNSDQAFQSSGRGLSAAFDMAYGQLAREEKLSLTKTKIKQTAQERRQDKQVLSAVNSTATQSAPSNQAARAKYDKLMDDYKKTKSAESLAEIIKMKGLMPNFG